MAPDIEFAPLEGITDAVYRRAHRAFYPGITRYYMPFISPTQNRLFTPRQLRELAPENNPGVPLIPQLLGKNSGDFLWAAGALADMGYKEINLNLGCPSGTVTAKGKGAGFLARPDELDRFLDDIYSAAPLRVSIKTRIGISDPGEFERLLAIYRRYPICRLIIHPRTGAQQYRGTVHMDVFRASLAGLDMPVSYNGDLVSADDVRRFSAAFPGVGTVMVGRGLVADPALAVKLSDGTGGKAALKGFHDRLCAEYPVVFESEAHAMRRMKGIWAYLLLGFAGGEAWRRRLIKINRWPEFLALAEDIFQTAELLPAVEKIPQ